MKSVYITQVAKYLPGNPIANDEMEDYLGMVGGKRSRARSVVLRNNGIKTRYYALDRDGRATHSNAQMTAAAVRNLGERGTRLDDVDLLTCGTTTPDQLLPSHASMVHGELKIRPIEAIGFSGSCCAGINAFKYAWMAVRTGLAANAISTSSEKLSSWMRAENFSGEHDDPSPLDQNPMLAFEKDFLRWMLSDGAAATHLSNRPNAHAPSLRVEWVDQISFAGSLETCMYAGAEKLADTTLRGWADYSPGERAARSLFSLSQDVRILDQYIAVYAAKSLEQMLGRHHLAADDIDHYLPHVSSAYFIRRVDDEMRKLNLIVPMERWFLNLTRIGNIGSASIFLALEELIATRPLQTGQRILLAIPESARFAYATALLTVV